MSNKELQEYLNRFPDDAPVSVILANPKKRKLYEINKIYIGSDFGHPAFFIDVGKESDMDEEIWFSPILSEQRLWKHFRYSMWNFHR